MTPVKRPHPRRGPSQALPQGGPGRAWRQRHRGDSPGTRRLLVECEGGAARLLAEARGLPGVVDVTVFGNALHLLVQDALPGERLDAALHGAAGGAVRTRPIEPSLEDVFVRLTRLQGARAA